MFGAKKSKFEVRITQTEKKEYIWSATMNGLFAGQGVEASYSEAVTAAGDAIVDLRTKLGGA